MEMDIYLAINIIVVLCALIISLFAARTYRQARTLKTEEKVSRRAYLAPSTDPGYLNASDKSEDESRLLISLQNYGLNPVMRGKARLMSYNEAEIGDELNEKPNPRFMVSFERHNALPGGSRWVMKLDEEKLVDVGISDMSILMSKYLVLNVRYSDPILGREFSDSFFWYVDADKGLVEINNYHRKLRVLAEEESV